MALKQTIKLQGDGFLNTPYGHVKTGENTVDISAYIKVSSIAGNKNSLNIDVNFFNENIEFNKSYNLPVSVDADAANFIKQAYEYLKTLPEFANSEDC
jgi:hypothetical protein